MPDYADQGTLSAMVETSPADVDEVAAEIKKLAADLARPGGITAEAVEAVRRPLLDGRARERETNGWWLQSLDGSKRRPEWLKDAVEWDRMIRSITREEVQRVATTWLTRSSLTAYVTPQAARARAPATAAGS
jgi:predicted Zn-dependent peptidase